MGWTGGGTTAIGVGGGTALFAEPFDTLPEFRLARAYGAPEASAFANDSDSDDAPPDPSILGRPLPDLEYALRPVEWMIDLLGIAPERVMWSLLPEYERHTWDGTPDPLVAIAESIARFEDVAVESGTGLQKTFNAAALALWFLATHEDALVITTAPKADQLAEQMWKEIGAMWSRFRAHYPAATRASLRIRLKPGTDEQEKWAAIGWACGVRASEESTTRAQGFHARFMLWLLEEMAAIPRPTLNAAIGTSTAPENVILGQGNPDNQHDTLHTFAKMPGVKPVRISALDHPNVVTGRTVVPGAQSRRGIDRLASLWGLNDPMYDSRVRGISPAQAADALIKLQWCHDAARLKETDPERYAKLLQGPMALGVDAAQSEAGDKAAIAKGTGAVLMEVNAFPCPNATKLGRQVYFDHIVPERIRPEHVGVDPVGVGAATVNALNELTPGCEHAPRTFVQQLGGGMAPVPRTRRAEDGQKYDWADDANRFLNLRAQMGWQLREDLRLGLIALPWDEELFEELIAVKWADEKHAGRVYLEPKEEVIARLGRSPNKADAVMYWNWVRKRLDPEPPPAAGPRPQEHRDPNPIRVDEDSDLDAYGASLVSGFTEQFGSGF